MRNYFNITVAAEWFTLFAAILLLNKKTKKWRLFIPILTLTIAIESAGWYMIYILKKNNNSLLFNLLMIINIVFFSMMLTFAAPLQKFKKVIHIALICFIFFSAANLIFLQGPWKYNFYTQATGNLILLVQCCSFFYLIVREEDYRELFHYEYFWLAAGLLFTSLGSILLYVFIDALMSYYSKTHVNVYGYINYGVNLLFYSSLIIAFICRQRNTK